MRNENFLYPADLTAAPGSTRAICEMVWQRLPGGHLGWERDVLRAWFTRHGIQLVGDRLRFTQTPDALRAEETP